MVAADWTQEQARGVVLKRNIKQAARQGLVARKKLLAVQVSAALMTAPLLASAVPPEAPPVQTETKAAAGQTPAAVTAPRLAEQRTPPPLPPMEQEFPGIPWGSFLAFPDLVLAATYDDNIYGQRRNAVDDGVVTLSSSVVLKSKWDKHALNFDVGADLDRYLNHDQENINDY
jgi:hypothetical protein